MLLFAAWAWDVGLGLGDAVEDWQGRDGVGLARLDEDCFQMLEDFFDAHGVHLTAGVVAFFDDGLQVMAGDLCGEVVGNDFAGALLLLDPGMAGHRDPHGLDVDVEANVNGVGVSGGDGHDIGLPAAMEIFAGPAVGDVEVLVHVSSVKGSGEDEQAVAGKFRAGRAMFFRVRARILRMIAKSSIPVLVGLAAVIALGIASQPRAAAQRPAYPIVQEIHVDGECRLLLAPADVATGKKARPQRDPVVCHIESPHNSEHMEEAIVGNELHRSRVAVQEHEFVLQNIAAAPVIFVVEQPVTKGWQIDSDPQPEQIVGTIALFRVHAQPGEIVHLHVGERHTTALKTKVIRNATPAPANSVGN